ncbi:MAG: leucine-rich repeat domain-containing protein [Gemmatimonadetes bacterium]|nr:leucine-rich repeat domain-containing protein [Gemmatimonadota bacterium]
MRPLALIAAVLSSLTLLPVAVIGQTTVEDTVRQAPLFEATIDDPDLVMSLKEIARERNRSWLKIDLVSGSGVGSSLWMVCQVRLLTELRGFSHFVVLEQVSDVDGAMEIGFLQSDSVDLKAEFGKDDFEYGEGLIVGPEMCAGRSLQTDTLRLLPTRLTLGSGPPLARQILPVLQPSELCSDQPGTAIATFEDAELEVWVRRATLSVGAQDDLTCGLVSGLADLGAISARIESLVGIQNLTSLSTLVLTNNAITDISALRGLTSLTTLHLAFNSISEISALRGLTNLTTLGLNGNSISDITPLSGLTNLTSLDLGSNSISDISALTAVTNFRALSLSANFNLTDIQPLLDNAGLGAGDDVSLDGTNVSCADITLLVAKGVTVGSNCPTPAQATVAIEDNQFNPSNPNIVAGGTVTWTWTGANQHNVTFSVGTSSVTQSSGTFSRDFSTRVPSLSSARSTGRPAPSSCY